MKIIKIYHIGILIAFCMFNSNLFAGEYKLGAGDVITMKIYGENDLNIDRVKIPKNGKITFPLIGDVKVKGRTLNKLKKNIIRRLKSGYLKNPELSLSIIEYRPFFVNGEVSRPGGYPYIEGLTIRKAIALAGGLTDRASLKKISIVPENKSKSKKLAGSLDMAINPGDIMTIGESLF